MKLCITKRKNF